MKDITIRLRIDGVTREKLDVARGELTISEYIRRLLGVATNVITEENVATKKKETVEDVATNVATESELVGEISRALEIGDRENWVRVKGLVSDMGYDWSITTRELRKGNNLIRRF
jgi:hypothetical protein